MIKYILSVILGVFIGIGCMWLLSNNNAVNSTKIANDTKRIIDSLQLVINESQLHLEALKELRQNLERSNKNLQNENNRLRLANAEKIRRVADFNANDLASEFAKYTDSND
jgi:hypothetical protein